MKPGEVNWSGVFAGEGCRWFHTGGIMSALSETAPDVAAAALEAARAAGAVTSYDLNFRGKLWTSQRAVAVTRQLAPLVQVLIGNEEDFQKALGFEVAGLDANLSSLPIESYKRMVEKVVETFPGIQAVCTTLREVKSGLVNNWSGILWHDGRFYESRRFENLEIEDRVGGGDGFSSGVAYGFLSGMTPQETVDFGAAYGALLQTTRGDTSQVDRAEVLHVMRGGSARIQR
jgi:2-dehydro-3-deoxygluconokinase